jgi:hypothetical protein
VKRAAPVMVPDPVDALRQEAQTLGAQFVAAVA